jgi:hypothetical protein
MEPDGERRLRLLGGPGLLPGRQASHRLSRARIRVLHALAERLAPYGFDGDYLFTEWDRRMLAEDTLQRRERDQETVEAWYIAQGRDRASEVEGAKEKLLAKLEARSK